MLHVLAGRGTDEGFKRVVVTEAEHPYVAGWWPPGHMLGYEHGFTHQALEFLTDIALDRQPEPVFRTGLGIQRTLDAVARSSQQDAAWTPITQH